MTVCSESNLDPTLPRQSRITPNDNTGPGRSPYHQNRVVQKGFSHWYTRWCRNWWALEVASIVLGSTCIISIAIMLWKVNGSEMPQWQFGLTIDAILSLLAGFSKSCLLMPTAEALGQLRWSFDEKTKRRPIDIERIDRASRGAWDSIMLLIRARGAYVQLFGLS